MKKHAWYIILLGSIFFGNQVLASGESNFKIVSTESARVQKEQFITTREILALKLQAIEWDPSIQARREHQLEWDKLPELATAETLGLHWLGGDIVDCGKALDCYERYPLLRARHLSPCKFVKQDINSLLRYQVEIQGYMDTIEKIFSDNPNAKVCNRQAISTYVNLIRGRYILISQHLVTKIRDMQLLAEK